MNDVQRRARCIYCIKSERCIPNAESRINQNRDPNDKVAYYEEKPCKGFLSFTKAKELMEEEVALGRDLSNEEIVRYYSPIPSYWKVVEKCRNRGKFGFGFKRGSVRDEYSVFGRVLGSWSQPYSGGYFIFDLEHKRYIKVGSFNIIKEVEK